MRRAIMSISPRSRRMYPGYGNQLEPDSGMPFEQSAVRYSDAEFAEISSYSDDTSRLSQKPSHDYLTNSLLPSISPSASRKLLVLDLNGSLLLRSPRRPRSREHRPRIVHPRPYMGAFSAYLFHDETMKWLDIMVWSSAQPHSVKDMVDKCFGKKQALLTAIWTRENMGLSEADYRRKTPTLKDLTKVWANSNSRICGEVTLPQDSSGLQLAASHSPSASGSSKLSIHSAQTTLLLDDSPLKATLQPFNLLCVREYDRATRTRDLIVLASRNRPGAGQQSQHSWGEFGNDGLEKVEKGDLCTTVNSIRRKVPGASKETQESLEENEAQENMHPVLAQFESSERDEQYDQTLLAVIGILDTLKLESNIASWMRAGGLWKRAPINAFGHELGKRSDMTVNAKRRKKATSSESDETVPLQKGQIDAAQMDPTSPEEVIDPWFTHASIMHHWTAVGLTALERLSIEVEPAMGTRVEI